MIDTHTPITPTMTDRAALLSRFWRPNPVYPTFPVTSPYISQGEAAERLGVTQGTVSRWLDDGTLAVLTDIVVSRRRIIRVSFDRWVADHVDAATEEVAAA